MTFNVPILLIAWNRPAFFKQLLHRLQTIRPSSIYISVDGPRPNYIHDDTSILETQQLVESQINWPCTIKKRYSPVNRGCKVAVSEAVTWFFENEHEGIILEDDCIPELDFFDYCATLLHRYRLDTSVGIISGYSLIPSDPVFSNSRKYFYSNHGGIWGWASWRRAWKYYRSTEGNFFDIYSDFLLERSIGFEDARIRTLTYLKSTFLGSINTWDYQWAFDRNVNNLKACVPVKSLVQNIGFGDNSTHTKTLSQKKTYEYKLLQPHNQDLAASHHSWTLYSDYIQYTYDNVHIRTNSSFYLFAPFTLFTNKLSSICKALFRVRKKQTPTAKAQDSRPSSFPDSYSKSNTFQILETFPTDGNPLHAHLTAAFGSLITDPLMQIYIHGSWADKTNLLFSDVDDLIIVDDSVYLDNNLYNVCRRLRLHATERYLSRLDPLQHHGHLIIRKSQLSTYDNSPLPLDSIDKLVSLSIPSSNIVYTKDPEACKKNALFAFRRTMYEIISLFYLYEQNNINMFDMKCLLSSIFLLPALSYQLSGTKITKALAIKKMLAQSSVSAAQFLTTASTIRSYWPSQSVLRTKILRLITYIPIHPLILRKILRKYSGVFPIYDSPHLSRNQLCVFLKECITISCIVDTP